MEWPKTQFLRGKKKDFNEKSFLMEIFFLNGFSVRGIKKEKYYFRTPCIEAVQAPQNNSGATVVAKEHITQVLYHLFSSPPKEQGWDLF